VYSADEYVAKATAGKAALSFDQWIAILYSLISVSVLVIFILALIKIYSIIRSHSIMSIDDIKFVNTEEKSAPFSFLNYVFWNKQIDLKSTSGEHIFQHELVHVREKHSFDKLFLQLVLIAFWCNPFFWLVRRELKMIHEFIADKKFKVADSLYANTRNSRYKKYIEGYFFNRFFMFFVTAKKKDGKYHFGYFERHYFKPKKKDHYAGNVYILTGGNSFSATTLFTQTVKPQENVFVVGEETGGGAYGNTAWLIPDLTLPETGIRFRLPLFRLVIDKDIPKDGRGVQPEVVALPTTDAIRRGADYKMDKVMELIRSHQ